jgi:hypothetical protein
MRLVRRLAFIVAASCAGLAGCKLAAPQGALLQGTTPVTVEGENEVRRDEDGFDYATVSEAERLKLQAAFQSANGVGGGLFEPFDRPATSRVYVGGDLANLSENVGPYTIDVLETSLSHEFERDQRATTPAPTVVLILPKGQKRQLEQHATVWPRLSPFVQRRQLEIRELSVAGDLGPSTGGGPKGLRTFKFIRDVFPLIVKEAGSGPAPTMAVVSTLHYGAINSPELRDLYMTAARELAAMVVADLRAQGADAKPVEAFDLVLEGGNLLSDARGTCFTSSKSVEMNRPEIVERRFRELFRCQRVVVLQMTGELRHVDMIMHVASPDRIFLNMPVPPSTSGGFQPLSNLDKNRNILVRAGYRVVEREAFATFKGHANILLTESSVYLPRYERTPSLPDLIGYFDRDSEVAPKDQARQYAEDRDANNRVVAEFIGKLHPARRVVPVRADFSNDTDGGIRCLTATVPRLTP